MTYKTIFKGRLVFDSPKSYDKVLRMYQHRVENFYKSADILLNEEEIFDKESTSLNVPRFITQGSEKSWKNTKSLLEYIAQFAVAGNLNIWMTSEGKILQHGLVEPTNDRTAVKSFLKGRELCDEAGKETEAMDALTAAITKYERHAQAYERRGHVNFILENHKDAIYDFSKSIDLAPGNPEPYLGRAMVYIGDEKYSEAIADFDCAIKRSIPLQPIYWQAMRQKSDCHIKLGELENAALGLKLFCRRGFTEDNPNYYWKKAIAFKYGRILLELDKAEEAVPAFELARSIEYKGKEQFSEADLYLNLGISLEKAGKNGFIKHWKKASELGSKEAKALLKKRNK